MLRPLVIANHAVSLCGTLLSTVGVDVDLATCFVIKISSSAAQRTQEGGTGRNSDLIIRVLPGIL